MMPVDRNGTPLREGAAVRLLRSDPGLLQHLPIEDRQAIEWARQEGELRLVGFASGNVELEFSDRRGGLHWIFVSPKDVAVA